MVRGFWVAVVMLITSPVLAGEPPQPSYWALWDQSNERNYAAIDHSDWDVLLQSHVVPTQGGVRQFGYADIGREERKVLNRYIKRLGKIDPRQYRKAEQQAYWMNLYNALSVQLIVDELADEAPEGAALSVDDKTQSVVKVAGQKLSLDDIEHRILRPLWQDHRIHFGLNRAAMDSPNMAPRAYTADNIKPQLKASAVEFINDDRGLAFDDGALVLSRVFSDYRQDFAVDHKTLLKFFAHYAKDRKALYLLGHQGPIRYVSNPALNSP